MQDSSPLLALQPNLVWRIFDEIRRIPRPSRREERIVEWVRGWAAAHDLSIREDDFGNLVVVVPATPGLEDAPVVVLQGHLDMVCEANREADHDFDQDPIDVRVESFDAEGDTDPWVLADGTTLGADNGVGVALAMAAAVDPEVEHGPLELLLTLDEETGLNGASAFDGDLLEGRLLVNLDSEDEGTVYIGCAGAGGLRAEMELPRRQADDRPLYDLVVRGLRGGHSGMEIQLGGANASKLAARLLVEALDQGADPGLVSFDGGDKANAIPRECFVRLRLDAESEATLRAALDELLPAWTERHGAVDEDLDVELLRLEEIGLDADAPPAFEPAAAERWLRLVDALHHGPLGLSRRMPGLVETSNNVAVARAGVGDVAGGRVLCAARSSVDPALDDVLASLASAARLAGAEAYVEPGYPGWTPDPGSELVRRTVEVHRRVNGEEPEVTAVHAGLECGILVQRVPGLDAVSFGPDIRGAHSPRERVSVPSVERTYEVLGELLAVLAED